MLRHIPLIDGHGFHHYECTICKEVKQLKLDELKQGNFFDIDYVTMTFICGMECLTKRKRVKHKFNAKKAESDGITFSSKAERAYYHRLNFLKQTGEVLFFLRQVPLHLPGNTKYVVDYQVFYADGTVSFVDVKGMSTPMFILKKKQVEDIYPIEIEVVKC